MSIQSQVNQTLTIKPGIKLKELQLLYPGVKTSSLKSCYYRAKSYNKKAATNNATDAYSDRITMDMVENLIIEGKTPVPILRVMTDFLKVKSQDHSELQEIDLSIFYKKAMED